MKNETTKLPNVAVLIISEIGEIEKEYIKLWDDFKLDLMNLNHTLEESEEIFKRKYPIIRNGFIIIGRLKRVIDNV